jgi:hypothetical protein
MAEPLTSSDYWRIQSGFGATPDTASRERFAAAGIAPLTTAEKSRRESGSGPFSSIESRRAFQAADVMEEGGPQADLPEEYGGRPKGSSRRAQRMAFEWDKMQQEAIQNQQMLEDMEIKRGVYNLRLDQEDRVVRDEKIAFEAAQLAEARAAKVQKEAEFIFDSIKGGPLTSDGVRTGSPINPYEEGALTQITNLMDSDGMEDPRAKDAVEILYKDALRAEEKRMADRQARSVTDVQTITDLTKLAKLTERNASDLFAIDPTTKDVIIDPSAVGEAQADLALREKRGEAKGPSYSDLNKDAGVLRGKIRDINLDIIVENNMFEKAETEKDKSLALSRIKQLEAQRDFLSTEYLGLQSVLDEGTARGGGTAQPEILKFTTPEEAEAAGLEAGTIVEIGGRRARID